MKGVKKPKTRVQKYQNYVNKKIAAVGAMTLSISTLLSPLATSANNANNQVYISPVSELKTINDEYINIELSYEDVEESHLNVELNIKTNLKNQLESEPEVTEEVVAEPEVTEQLVDGKQIETELNIKSDIESLLDSSDQIVQLKEMDYHIAGFLNTNFSFQSIIKKLSNSFSFLTKNTQNEEQISAFVLEIPIHSAVNLDKDSFMITNKDGEKIIPSELEVNKSYLKVGFDQLSVVPSQFKVSFNLEPSNSIVEGQIAITEGAMIEYKLANNELKKLEIPKIDLNLYQISQFLGLAPLEISSNTSKSNGCANTANTNDPIRIDDNRELCIDKVVTSEPNENGEYTITLDTNGILKNKEVVSDTDIVVVIDRSSSMSQEIKNLRKYVDGFITNMLSLNNEQSPDAVRVAVVTFDGNAQNFFGENKINLSGDKVSVQTHGFINTYKDKNAQSLIKNLTTGRGTNTQMGIKIANDLLTLPAENGGRPDANKYVVLFTDGEPYTNNRAEDYFKTNQNNFTAAQAEYYDHFKGPLNNGTTTLKLGGIKYNNKNEAILDYKLNVIPSNNVTFYSIGYFEGLTIPSKDSPDYTDSSKRYHNITSFLYSIQNVAQDLSTYKETYFTNKISNLGQFYEKIGNDIKNQITSLLTEVSLTDIVPDYLDIVENSFNINPSSVSAYKGKVEKTITWSLGTLSEEGVTLSFKVVSNNDYFGAIEKDGSTLIPIKTNKSATIVAKELPNGATYPVPTVTIAPVEGGIKVVKEVKKGNSVYNTTDKFSVNVMGPSQLGFEVAGNGSQEVSFYLRDVQTDISYNKDYSKNYLTVGSYSVDEIVPANYEWTNLNVQYCNSTYTTCKNVKEDGSSFTLSDKFDISINHKYIKIILTNELVNENYWYDKKHTPNEFIYTKPTSSGDIAIAE